jgi:para-aminobenzoate synthetase component 1
MQPPRLAEIPYHPDSGARFAALAKLPWAIFLDSAWPRSARGRYDIFAAEPYVTLTTRGEISEIQTCQGTTASRDNPFELVKRYLGEPVIGASDLPFSGGAMGYFAYDLGRRVERLPSLAVADIPLPEMAIGLYDWAVVVDHLEKRAWLVGAGRDPRTLDEWALLLQRIETPEITPSPVSFRVHQRFTCNFDWESYSRAFQKIKRYIREGDCYQVNLAQRFSVKAEGEIWGAYRQLQRLNPAPFSSFFNLPCGTVLSSSPERFLQVRDGVVETKPIKGTRPRSTSHLRDEALAEELRGSMKDRAENLMIVDLLRNDLGKTCAIGSVKVPKLFEIESFSTVHHLVSTVTGQLAPGKHALDLLGGCFPGGSITGAPKLRAMEIIEELEPHRRGLYCGAIGYAGFDGSMDTNIAIRTLILCDGYIHCWAGGGIVVDSDLESEYQECLYKAEGMLRLLTTPETMHVGG